MGWVEWADMSREVISGRSEGVAGRREIWGRSMVAIVEDLCVGGKGKDGEGGQRDVFNRC